MLSSRRTSFRGHTLQAIQIQRAPRKSRQNQPGVANPFAHGHFRALYYLVCWNKVLILPFHARNQLQEDHGQRFSCKAFQAKGRIRSKNMLCNQNKFREPRGNQGKI